MTAILIAALPYLLPLILLVWAMSPMSVFESDQAQKRIFWATYPRASIGGNNPASQRVHEGGGFRLTSLLVVLVQLAIAAVAGEADTAGGGLDALVAALLAQLVAAPLTFLVTRRLIDLAEHGAEIAHGDANPLDPVAADWMEQRGFASYREAEAWRMTRRGQEYDNLDDAAFLAKIDRLRWLSHIIRLLGAW